MEPNIVELTQNSLNHENVGKRRKVKLEDWADNQAKVRRNSGLSYTSRNGKENESVEPPNMENFCEPRCNNEGCQLPYERKLEIFQQFWRLKSWNLQSTSLMQFMDWEAVAQRTVDVEFSRRKCSYKYYIGNESSVRLRVCLKTFLSVFGISYKRVRTVQKKMQEGRIVALDLRGIHANRPHKHPTSVKENIISHIRSFPTTLSHYSRNEGDPLRQYLGQDLNVSKMFELYCEVAGEEVFTQKKVYYDVFKELNLRFRTPRSDTCDNCDENFVAISKLDETNPEHREELNYLWTKSVEHHLKAESGFAVLREDNRRSKVDPNYVVLAIDLEAIIGIPRMTNGSHYYKRKLHCYNVAIHEASSDTTTMCLWNQREGKRGASEIFSCIFKFCREKYNVLAPGESRTLVVWSDRCCGQNNNFETVCGYRFLIELGYFTEIQQKFLCTGHSFLPCDRQFALLERQMKILPMLTMEDITKLILCAKISNPFQIQRMTQTDILDFNVIVRDFRRPASLKVTQTMVIKLTSELPEVISEKKDHDSTQWNLHNLVRRRPLSGVPPQKYLQYLPLDDGLISDLVSMQKFMIPSSSEFWSFLPLA